MGRLVLLMAVLMLPTAAADTGGTLTDAWHRIDGVVVDALCLADDGVSLDVCPGGFLPPPPYPICYGCWPPPGQLVNEIKEYVLGP